MVASMFHSKNSLEEGGDDLGLKISDRFPNRAAVIDNLRLKNVYRRIGEVARRIFNLLVKSSDNVILVQLKDPT